MLNSDKFIFCGTVFTSDGETGSDRKIYWNSEEMIVAIGYYKHMEANGDIPEPESFTYYDWNHLPTFRDVIVNNMKGDCERLDDALKNPDLNLYITCGKLPYFENHCLYLYPSP